jgi:hypothetical protein
MPLTTSTPSAGVAVSTVSGKISKLDIDRALQDFTRAGQFTCWVFDLSQGGDPPMPDVQEALATALGVARRRGLQKVMVVTKEKLVALGAQIIAAKAGVLYSAASTVDEALALARSA